MNTNKAYAATHIHFHANAKARLQLIEAHIQTQDKFVFLRVHSWFGLFFGQI